MFGSSPSSSPSHTLGPSSMPLPSSMPGSSHQMNFSFSEEYGFSGTLGSSHMLEPAYASPSDLHTLDRPHTSGFAQEFHSIRDYVSWNTVGTSHESPTLPNSATPAANDGHIVAANHNLPLENDLRLVDPRLVTPPQASVATSRQGTVTTSSDTTSPITTTSSSRFQCDMCPFSYDTAGKLQRHRSEKHQAYTAKGKVRQQNRSQRRPYKCDVQGCSKDFPTQWKLNTHRRNIHDPESEYNKLKNQKDVPCLACGRIWGTDLSLRDHMSRSPSCRIVSRRNLSG